MFARYAKEDFDSGDLERMQYVMKTLGTELKLSGRTVLFSPVKYLIPIKKAVSELESNSKTVPTSIEQGSNKAKVPANELWWSV